MELIIPSVNEEELITILMSPPVSLILFRETTSDPINELSMKVFLLI